MKETKYIEITQEYVEKIYESARDVFCNGLYVKCGASHPCGWDFINFEDTDLETSSDVMDQPIEINAISGGCYAYHEYEDLTLYEIIKEVGMDGWCFEISGTDKW